MDWLPLAVGLLLGTGNAMVSKYVPGTGSLGRHKHLIYNGSAFGIGLWGEWTGKLSPDVAYGMMVASAALVGESVPNALAGGGISALGATYPDGQRGPAPTYDPNAPWPSSPHLTAPSAAGARYSTGRTGIWSATPGVTEPTAAGAIHYDRTEVERAIQATRSYTPVGAAG